MWLHKLRKRKGQVCVIFLMLLTSTLLMAGSLGIFTSLIKPYEEFVEETDAPSVRAFLYEEGQEENVEMFTRLEEVARVIPLKRYMVEEKVTYQEKTVNETIALVEYQEEAFANIRMIQGENTRPNEEECLMPYALANSLGMKVGEQLFIQVGETRKQYTICGFYTAPYSCNILYQSEILVASLPEGVTQTVSYSIYGKDSYSGQDIVDAYVAANNGIMDGRFDTIEDVVSNITLNEKILGGILLALSVIAFLVCVVMIRFLIKNALYHDRKTIAVYKTIGYQQRDILHMYMKFYMSIALVGTFVGAVASPILSSSFIKPAFRNIGLEKTSISWWPRLIVMIGVLILIAIQVLLGVHKWKKVKPVIVLNDRESTLGVKKVKNPKWKGSMDFSPMHMARRLIQRNKKSTIYVIITCFLSIYMVNFAIVAYTNVSSMPENNYYWLGFDEHDVSLITMNHAKFQENCETIAQLPEVDRLVLNKFDFHASMKWQKGMANPNIECMVYDTYEGITMPMVEGRNPKAENEIVVGNLLAKELHKQIGDYIDLYFGTDKKVSLLIVGTFQSFMNMGRCVRLLGDTILGAGVDFHYTDASVYLKDSCTPQEFVDAYEADYKDSIKIQKRTDKYDEMLDEICDPQLAAIGPFIAIVLVIGCLNIICIIYLQNITNRRKYAIYKSIGYSVSHLIRMNIWYVGIIAVASVIVAVPIFVFAYPKIMTLSMSMFGFAKYPVFFQPGIMFFGNLALMVLFLISALLTSKSLRGSQLKELAQE
ncbi:ABC transporter permease [Anaerosporobacter faecicola]|uniref:ABC transporter permease n=1 Tax=Anaerosporobacter faecicola TaxID=2718714 RepID=UPI00143BA594|nr:FtsX-like permease family protein [Anaerosporobacter faecicola]